MADEGTFTIDVAELDAVIADVEQAETKLESITEDLEHQIAALQAVWEGLAADAQQAAQQEWQQGMLDMRAALADLRGAARRAHGNYTAASQANLEMWESLS